MTPGAAHILIVELARDLGHAVTHGGVWIHAGRAENLLDLLHELDAAAARRVAG